MDGTKRLLRKVDMFGVPVTLKFKNNNTFRTSLGGFCSILILILFAFLTY